jgi:pyruvyltransferase
VSDHATVRAARLYWCRLPNFGDALNRDLLPAYGVPVRPCADAARSDIIGIGSILEKAPETYAGTILGAGFMDERSARRFPCADIRALRGRLSAERCRAPKRVCLGDPGLLAAGLFKPSGRKQFELGIVPHFVDREEPALRRLAERYRNESTVIDVEQAPEAVVEQISQCAHIASSSLHGLVVADSLAIPNLWMYLGDGVLGQGFKFRDYWSAFGAEAARRQQVVVRGDERLSSLIDAMVRPEAAIADVMGRLEQTFAGLSVVRIRRWRRAGSLKKLIYRTGQWLPGVD